jgi:hypothetical protein
MVRFLCVPVLINGGSAPSRTGSETTEDQRSKQVSEALYTKDEYEDNNGGENKITSENNS